MQPSPSVSRLIGLIVLLVLVASPAVSAQTDPPSSKPLSTTDKIAFYQKQVEAHPRHYPAYARLGRTWLEHARQSYDPAAIAKARSALRRSLEIQPNYEAQHDSAAVANYSHRFEEALKWCQQAAETLPEDKGVVAMRVEALLALGRSDEVRATIGGKGEPAKDFYTAAALGHWHVSQGRREDAVTQFLVAARLAEDRNANSLAIWSTVTAAGVWLDSGDVARAKPLLDAASRLDPADRFLKIHRAELAAIERRPADALGAYEELLSGQADPELHRRAFVLAKQLGRSPAAEQHFAAAEKLGRRVVDAGEVYSLEMLANLYFDAGRVAEAARFAQRNFQFKRDAAAKETLSRVRQPGDQKHIDEGVR